MQTLQCHCLLVNYVPSVFCLQIVSLSSNQKQPEALDKINFLQERLREIRAEIEQKARPVVDREDVPSEDTEACQRDNQQVGL